jgi:integrase
MRRFFIYRRASGVYYAELLDPRTGARIASRSTGKRNRDEAVLVADDWARHGLPDSSKARRSLAESLALEDLLASLRVATLTPADALRIVGLLRGRGLLEKAGPLRVPGGSRLTVRAFAEGMLEEDSEYLTYRARRGRPLSNNHRLHSATALKLHVFPLIGEERLADLTAARLERLQDELLARSGAGSGRSEAGTLRPATVNLCMQALHMVIKEAIRKGVLFGDPFRGVTPLSIGAKVRRGVFTPEELDRLFSADPDPWSVRWARVFFLIARYTGLRKGELQALRMGSFFERIDGKGRAYAVVRVSGSWDRIVFKAPKNGRERTAVIPPTPWPEVRAYLESLEKPDPAALVFEGEAEGRPFSPRATDYRLRLALGAIGIDAKAKRARHLSAHSFRYQVNSVLVNAGVANIRAQALLGHVSGDAMTATYYQAGEDFSDVIEALEK